MRATEILRGLLDLIDNIDSENDSISDFADENVSDCGCGDDCGCSDCQSKLANSPNELIATVNMVTTDAGGGVNGPKHPADLKTATFPLYPNLQFKE